MPRPCPVRTKPIPGTELRQPERGGGGRVAGQAGEDERGVETGPGRVEAQPIGLRQIARGTGNHARKGKLKYL